VGIVGVAFALFTAGYILGVWTACLVFRESQAAYEDGLPVGGSRRRVIELAGTSRPVR
jgi:hypothetical protein